MNHQRLDAAVKRFTPLIIENKEKEEIIAVILKDSKLYTREEAETIYANMDQSLRPMKEPPKEEDVSAENSSTQGAGNPAVSTTQPPQNVEQPKAITVEEARRIVAEADAAAMREQIAERKKRERELSAVGMIRFDIFKVKTITKKMFIPGRGTVPVISGYKKVGEKIKSTNCEQRHANIMNQQTPNSFLYYFKEGEDDFIPAEVFFGEGVEDEGGEHGN